MIERLCPLTLVVALLCAACATSQPPSRPAAPSIVSPSASRRVTTESLDDRRPGEGAMAEELGEEIAAVSPPDPAELLASIGPSMPPERATSLRLIDEGRRLLDQGDDAGAIDRIESAVKIDPANPHGYYWLAQAHVRRGRLDQALAFADKASVLFGADDRAWLAQTFTFRGSVLERAGRFPEARASYRRAVDLEPGSVSARAGLARLGGSSASAEP